MAAIIRGTGLPLLRAAEDLLWPRLGFVAGLLVRAPQAVLMAGLGHPFGSQLKPPRFFPHVTRSARATPPHNSPAQAALRDIPHRDPRRTGVRAVARAVTRAVTGGVRGPSLLSRRRPAARSSAEWRATAI
jgi:hypothetical protein